MTQEEAMEWLTGFLEDPTGTPSELAEHILIGIHFRTEKDICAQRGHQPSDIILASNPPMNRCRWCSTVYRFDTVLVEQ